MDVAVAGGRGRRRDAEGDQGVGELVGELLGGVDGPAELLDRLDDVVGRHDDDGRVRVLAGDEGGPEADARGGVAAHGSPTIWSAGTSGSCCRASSRWAAA